jgi:hypothetical protein
METDVFSFSLSNDIFLDLNYSLVKLVGKFQRGSSENAKDFESLEIDKGILVVDLTELVFWDGRGMRSVADKINAPHTKAFVIKSNNKMVNNNYEYMLKDSGKYFSLRIPRLDDMNEVKEYFEHYKGNGIWKTWAY